MRDMTLHDGRQARAARVILGLTVQEMADAAGLHKNSVLRIEALQRIRQGWSQGGYAVGLLASAIKERGVLCDMVDGKPTVSFSTTKEPPKYRSKAARASEGSRSAALS